MVVFVTVYACIRKGTRNRYFRKIISKVDKETQGMVLMAEVYGTKRQLYEGRNYNVKYFKGFSFKVMSNKVEKDQLRNSKVIYQ